MLQSKANRLIPVGLLMLAGGLMLRVLVSGPRSESASAFLMGIALVFIAFGFLKGNGT
jgi:hypothetical protein